MSPLRANRHALHPTQMPVPAGGEPTGRWLHVFGGLCLARPPDAPPSGSRKGPRSPYSGQGLQLVGS